MDNVIIVENGKPMTTSLEVAKYFDKEHGHILRAIDDIINKGLANIGETLKEKAMAYFELSEYINEQNHQTYRMYKMNQKGFTLLAGGFTDKKFMEYKVMFVEQFDDMQKQLEQVELSDQQTNLITAEAHKMQVENERLKELRLAMNQADKLERNDLSERLLEKEVETLVGHQVKHAVSIDYNSPFHLTASNIAERFGIPATRVGSVAKLLGMDEGVDRIKVDERWLYTERAVSKMRARLEA